MQPALYTSLAVLLIVSVLIGTRALPRNLGILVLRQLLVLLLVLAVTGSLNWVLIAHSGLPKEMLPSAITAGAIAIGWIVTFSFREFERLAERNQTRRDVLTALRSEVFTAFQTLDATDWKSGATEVQGKIKDGGDGPDAYFPFTASESPPIVFEALAESIPVLEEAEIGPILRFYAALTDLTTVVKDCRDPAFVKLSAARRVKIHQRLTDTRLAALFWAVQALYRINTSLGVKNPQDIPRTGKNVDILIDRNAMQ